MLTMRNISLNKILIVKIIITILLVPNIIIYTVQNSEGVCNTIIGDISLTGLLIIIWKIK